MSWLVTLISALGAIAGCGTLTWIIIRAHQEDDASRRAAVWKRMEELRGDLESAKRDLAKLREKILALPSRDLLDERLGKLEEKMETRLEGLSRQLQDVLLAVTQGRAANA